MLNPSKLYFYSLISRLIPLTRGFSLKARLLRWCGAKVGNNVRICSSVKIFGCGDLSIGDNVWIGADTMISCGSKIEIGKNVDIGPLVYIGTGSHDIDITGNHIAGKGYNSDIIIGEGVWLGARCSILPSGRETVRTIGSMCVVAAGSIVVSDTHCATVFGGVPAKKIRSLK